MTRTELCKPETFYMLMHVYDVYKKMKEKYQDDIIADRGYEFKFYDYCGTGQNVVMRPEKFLVFDCDAHDDDNAIFSIESFDTEHPTFVEFCLTNDYFSWFNGTHNTDLCLAVGDHPTCWDKRYISVCEYSSAEEIFEEYTEEYFFQQLTVQDIIPYEQFQNEVNWYYKYISKNFLRKNEMIYIDDISKFNLKTLEGFRVI